MRPVAPKFAQASLDLGATPTLVVSTEPIVVYGLYVQPLEANDTTVVLQDADSTTLGIIVLNRGDTVKFDVPVLYPNGLKIVEFSFAAGGRAIEVSVFYSQEGA